LDPVEVLGVMVGAPLVSKKIYMKNIA